MISLEKWYIFTPLQKLLKNVGDWDKLIVAKGFKKLPKVQLIAQSGHTGLGREGGRGEKNVKRMSINNCNY